MIETNSNAHTFLVPVGKDIPAVEFDLTRLAPVDLLDRMAAEAPIAYRNMRHGVKQKLADARAGVNPKSDGYSPENATAAVLKVRDNFYKGEWGRERGVGESLNPFESRVQKLARAAVVAIAKANGHKAKDISAEAMATYIAKVLASKKGDAIRVEARRQLDEEAAMADISLDDLLSDEEESTEAPTEE